MLGQTNSILHSIYYKIFPKKEDLLEKNEKLLKTFFGGNLINQLDEIINIYELMKIYPAEILEIYASCVLFAREKINDPLNYKGLFIGITDNDFLKDIIGDNLYFKERTEIYQEKYGNVLDSGYQKVRNFLSEITFEDRSTILNYDGLNNGTVLRVGQLIPYDLHEIKNIPKELWKPLENVRNVFGLKHCSAMRTTIYSPEDIFLIAGAESSDFPENKGKNTVTTFYKGGILEELLYIPT